MECWKNGILGIETDNTAIFVIAFPFQEFIQMDQSHHSNIPQHLVKLMIFCLF